MLFIIMTRLQKGAKKIDYSYMRGGDCAATPHITSIKEKEV